ncbi:ABC transporter permease [Ectobacillus ponti]|uniref:ABC transporter permease n=1 Tax=Ectobacillus ponti TaxID=2961894 RepID=A0AA42BRG6_9BACI|nr:ABC transporter permease [Ectobacillus ponti]MCP8970917.1 ABC transporter permease [Ectobacillus ponti]
MLQQVIDYLDMNQETFVQYLNQHLLLCLVTVILAILLCVPLGVYISRKAAIAEGIINVINMFRVIPSIAILALAMPVLGVGFLPALVALFILACPPIIINTYTAFRKIDPSIREAAYGMGMSPMQSIFRVEFPLAMPVILTGIRTATVEIIASATLAVLIGGGGLGYYIMNGIAMLNNVFLLLGAIPVALLAIIGEIGFGIMQKRTSSF